MGLEYLDLSYRIEKEFNVFLSNEDHGSVRTVGDLEELITKRSTSVWPCPHIPAFSKLCSGIAELSGQPESDINLETELDQFVSPLDRSNFWQQLEERTSLELPLLETSHTLRVLGCGFSLALFGIPFLYLLESAVNLSLRPEFFFVLLPICLVSLIVFLKCLEQIRF